MKRALATACATVALGLGSFTPAQVNRAKVEESTLPPDIEQAFREFSKKAAESRRKEVTKRLEQRAKQLVTQVKLDAEAQAKLAEYYPRIVEATQAAWQDRFQDWLRPHLVRSPDPAANLDSWDAESMAANRNEAWARPDSTEVWKEALATVLNDIQLEKYQTEERERREKLRADLQVFLDAGADRNINLLQPTMDYEITRLRQLTQLEDQRVERLRAAAKAAISKVVDNWRREAEESLLEMEDDQLEQKRRSGIPTRFDTSLAKNQPVEQEIWKNARQEILTAAEREQIAKREEELRVRRSQALAMVLVEALDPYFGFSGDQREHLQRLLAAPLRGLPDHYFISTRPNSYHSIDPQKMWGEVSDLNEGVLQQVLDETQRKRWREMSAQDLARYHRSTSRGILEGLAIPPEKEMSELEARKLVSRYIHAHARELTARNLRVMEARAQALTRVAGLSAEQSSILRSAAKGTARELATNSIRNLEYSIRRSVQDLEPAKLADRLKRIGTPSYHERNLSGRDHALWASTIRRVLSPAQMKDWNHAQEKAQTWRRQAQVAMVISEIEKSVLLAPKSREILSALVVSHLDTYQEELQQNLTPQWHWEGYYCLIPLALIDDEKLETVLDKDQIASARGRIPGHFGTLLDNIRKRHRQRIDSKS